MEAAEKWARPAAVAVTLLGLLLRLDSWWRVPAPAPNGDEWDWSLTGLTLLTRGTPVGWTLFPTAYPRASWTPAPPGVADWIVHPYLDNPPLLSLLAGTIVYLRGDRTFEQVVHDPAPRLLAIAMTTATIWLAFAVGERVLGALPALLGAALYAVSPAAVVFGRVLAAEEIVGLCLLAAAWAALDLDEARRPRLALALLGFACFLGPLAKGPGVVVGAAAVLYLGIRGRWLGVALAAAATAAGTGVVLLYAAALDWHAFTTMISLRAASLTLGTPFTFITSRAGIGSHYMLDGWWLAGWLGLAGLLATRRSDLLTLPPVLYAVALIGMATDYSGPYGWYRLAVMPFVYLAAGDLGWRAIVEPTWTRFVLFALGAVITVSSYAGVAGWRPSPLIAALIGAALLVPGLAVLTGRIGGRAFAAGAVAALLVLMVPFDLLLSVLWT